MAKVVQQPGPMMGAPAGFHHHLGRRELAEEGFHLGAFEIAPQDGAVELVHAMQREDVLGGVDGDALILHADGPWLRMTTQLWHAMPWGRPPQQRPRPLTLFIWTKRSFSSHFLVKTVIGLGRWYYCAGGRGGSCCRRGDQCVGSGEYPPDAARI